MGRARLEAFSDGVIAIVITIMVLEIKVPHGGDLAALRPVLPFFLSYLLSFTFIGIYWNNHHHMLHATKQVNGRILWANLHLLFWLSLIPVGTAWVGGHPFEAVPAALYGVVLLFAGVAYLILTRAIVAHNGRDSALAKAIGNDLKGKVSAFLYVLAVPLAFASVWIAHAIYVFVAALWLVPDPRIEKLMSAKKE